jgi:hypothetical protein
MTNPEPVAHMKRSSAVHVPPKADVAVTNTWRWSASEKILTFFAKRLKFESETATYV